MQPLAHTASTQNTFIRTAVVLDDIKLVKLAIVSLLIILN